MKTQLFSLCILPKINIIHRYLIKSASSDPNYASITSKAIAYQGNIITHQLKTEKNLVCQTQTPLIVNRQVLSGELKICLDEI